MKNANYEKLTAGLIAAWFVFAFLAGALHVFQTDPKLPPLALGLAGLIPIVVFLFWFGTSKGFREFTLALNPRSLTVVQSWRIAGLAFLTLYTVGLLPGFFALPAGWGDIAIGATAPWVATRLVNFSHRRSFIFWQILGIFDLVSAVTLGTTARLISPHGVTTALMTVLPLSLIPTFGVPLFIMLHVISIAQARRWKKLQYEYVEEQLPASA
jgi:hypothetical protein